MYIYKKKVMLHEKINDLIAQAMKDRETLRLSVYRLIKNEFLKYEKSDKYSGWTEGMEISILLNMMAQRKDSIAQYAKADRMDLAETEMGELEIIGEFVPKEPTKEELDSYVHECIGNYVSTKGDEYKLSMRDMAPILGIVKEKYPTADGKTVSQILKSLV